MPCIGALINRWGRGFYLDAVDERKGRNVKDGDGDDERNGRGGKRGRLWKKKGVLLEFLSWPSLHYITEMLQHWWHRRAGRRTGPGDDVINNQSENSGAGRVWPAPEAEIVGSLKMYFPPLKSWRRCVLCAFSWGYFWTCVKTNIFQTCSCVCYRAKGKRSWLSQRGESLINLALRELAFNQLNSTWRNGFVPVHMNGFYFTVFGTDHAVLSVHFKPERQCQRDILNSFWLLFLSGLLHHFAHIPHQFSTCITPC